MALRECWSGEICIQLDEVKTAASPQLSTGKYQQIIEIIAQPGEVIVARNAFPCTARVCCFECFESTNCKARAIIDEFKFLAPKRTAEHVVLLNPCSAAIGSIIHIDRIIVGHLSFEPSFVCRNKAGIQKREPCRYRYLLPVSSSIQGL